MTRTERHTPCLALYLLRTRRTRPCRLHPPVPEKIHANKHSAIATSWPSAMLQGSPSNPASPNLSGRAVYSCYDMPYIHHLINRKLSTSPRGCTPRCACHRPRSTRLCAASTCPRRSGHLASCFGGAIGGRGPPRSAGLRAARACAVRRGAGALARALCVGAACRLRMAACTAQAARATK
jgi:hypothetical protein